MTVIFGAGRGDFVCKSSAVVTFDRSLHVCLGTPDYKYGQRVVVIAICAAPQWTDTERGLEMGDLRAVGYENIPHKSVGGCVAISDSRV